MEFLMAMLTILIWQTTSFVIISQVSLPENRAYTLSSYGQLVTSRYALVTFTLGQKVTSSYEICNQHSLFFSVVWDG